MNKRFIQPGVTRALGQNRPLFDSKTGEINASSNADAIKQIGAYLQLLASSKPDRESIEASLEKKRINKEELQAAFADSTGKKMQMLAETIGVEVIETTNREGFARRLVQLHELGQGEIPLLTVREKQVLAFMLSAPTQVTPVEIRSREFLLNEYSLSSAILIDNRTIARSTKDLLEEKYEEALEAIMAEEDRSWKRLADRAAVSRNKLEVTSTFTPGFFAKCTDLITRTGLPCSTCLMSSTIIQDMIAGAEFQQVFDPMTQYEVLQTGEIGQLYSVSILTDMPRQSNLKVLEPGEAYFLAPAENLGAMFVRPLVSQPIDRYAMYESKRGWFFDQGMSMAIVNGMAILKAQRLA